MTTPLVDDFLPRLAPEAPVPVAEELVRARDSVRDALGVLREVPDAALVWPWEWRGGEVDVRYGFYRQYEVMEDARARTRPLLSGASEAPARPLVAAASTARWNLHGLLAGLDDEVLDRDPGNREWTVRQTLAHIVGGQRYYASYTAWWLARRDAPAEDFPQSVPDDAIDLPEEESEGEGSLADIQRRLDEIVDLSIVAFAHLGAAELAARARWSRLPVDIRFRLVRWASHIREHTIQVEKTLGYIGRPLTEVDRLLRLVADAYGRLEKDLLPAPASAVRFAEALALAESAASEVQTATRSVAEAARRG